MFCMYIDGESTNSSPHTASQSTHATLHFASTIPKKWIWSLIYIIKVLWQKASDFKIVPLFGRSNFQNPLLRQCRASIFVSTLVHASARPREILSYLVGFPTPQIVHSQFRFNSV